MIHQWITKILGNKILIFIGFYNDSCREEGIRTLDTLLTHTRFPSVRLKPLGHLSIFYLSSLNIAFELS